MVQNLYKGFIASKGKIFQYPHLVYYQHTIYNSSMTVGSIFSPLLTRTNPIASWDATVLALILHLHLFNCFAFLKLNMLDKKSCFDW